MKKILMMLIVVTMVFGVVRPVLAGLNDGLVANYPFNGNANDESGNANHGTVNGATSTDDRFGNVNSAYSFDGVNDYIDIPYSPEIEPSIFTISLWVKTTDADRGALINSNVNNNSSCLHGYNVRVNSDGRVNFSVDIAGCSNAVGIISDSSINDDAWHHLVATYDSSLRFYIDGVLQYQTAISGYDKTNASIRIGVTRSNTDPWYFLGSIDDVRIYNRTLSEPEIQELFNEIPGNNQAPPIADAGTDQSVYVNDTVTLDGSNSWDQDGDSLTYSWTLTSIPTGSTATLTNSATVSPFFAVDVAGAYVISLTVNDGTIDSAPDEVTISTINVAPIADAGDNQSVVVGDMVFLDGNGSSDPDGDALTYSWSFTSVPSGSSAAFDDNTSITPDFIPDTSGTYEVSLIVNDGTVDSVPDTMSVSAVTQQTAAITTAQETMDVMNGLDEQLFNNPNNQNALTNKLNAVIVAIENGEYEDSLKKLKNDILKKMDGCAKTGEPDKNDWIKDCDAQAEVYPLVLEMIALLEQLI